MNKPFKIAIIGAGAAGLFTAAAIKRNLPNIEVEVVFDPKLKHIGVGESLGFFARKFFRDILKIEEKDWLEQSQSTYKLGIKFVGWDGTDKPRVWGYGGTQMLGIQNQKQGYTLDDIWLEFYKKGLRKLEDFDYDFPEARFCANNRPLDKILYTYQINAEYIKDVVHDLVGKPCGVKERPVPIKEVFVTPDGNNIDYLLLEDGSEVRADMFIDSTGFGRLLVKKLPFEFESFGEYYNDTAIVGPYWYKHESERNRVFTDHYAMNHGWRFSVPLTERTGEGYICNSHVVNDVDKIVAEWEQATGKKDIIGRKITWEPGHLKQTMIGNCVVIGLGYGMIDPFDANVFSTSLKSIAWLVDYLGKDVDKKLDWSADFNNKMARLVTDVRLRIDVGLQLASKNDTEYWQHKKEAAKKFNTLERIVESINTQERKFHAEDMYAGQHSYLEFLMYYGFDISKLNIQESSATAYTKAKVLEMFKEFNKIHRSMDLTNCHRLIPRRSSMDRTILS